jgi:hypothetical protein
MYYNSNLAQYRCYRDGDWEPCGTKPIDRGWEINDDFLGGAVAVGTGIGNESWTHVTISTACTLTYNNNAAPAPSADRPGILKMTTNTTAAASTGCRVYQGTSTGGTLALAAGQLIKAAMAPGTITSGAILLRVGADASTVTSNAQPTTSGVWWEADPATNANWRYCYSTGAAATCANSTVPWRPILWRDLRSRSPLLVPVRRALSLRSMAPSIRSPASPSAPLHLSGQILRAQREELRLPAHRATLTTSKCAATPRRRGSQRAGANCDMISCIASAPMGCGALIRIHTLSLVSKEPVVRCCPSVM